MLEQSKHKSSILYKSSIEELPLNFAPEPLDAGQATQTMIWLPIQLFSNMERGKFRWFDHLILWQICHGI